MKAVIQRIKYADVCVDGKEISRVENGLLVLLGVHNTDNEETAKLLAKKCANLRIFTDENDKMNKSVLDINGEILVISNFTLCADTKKGNRPSFIEAMEPKTADELYNLYCEELNLNGVKKVGRGVFGADMKVSLLNDGPVTIILDTDTWSKK
ncbi:MAG: D-tyrosyl-tRNA(Tyr) deacylase [Ruminococcaceae bacterium]|nr:D-tyrosyl-tRNA(Tyr) deacylase [Oscillospiraceae bacterium]